MDRTDRCVAVRMGKDAATADHPGLSAINKNLAGVFAAGHRQCDKLTGNPADTLGLRHGRCAMERPVIQAVFHLGKSRSDDSAETDFPMNRRRGVYGHGAAVHIAGKNGCML